MSNNETRITFRYTSSWDGMRCSMSGDDIYTNSVSGMGWDMRGDLMGQYITAKYQNELKAIAPMAWHTWKDGEYIERLTDDGHLYGLTAYHNGLGLLMEIDGKTGINAVLKIAQAIGLTFYQYEQDQFILKRTE